MRLYFIRHGQSENNALWDATGSSRGRSTDPELTEKGHEQAKCLGDFIRSIDHAAQEKGLEPEPKRDFFGITHLYTSLMVRSVATGTYISKAIGVPLTAWSDIHECGGIYEDDEETGEQVGLPGKPRSYFALHYSDLILPDALTEDGWWNRPFESRVFRPVRAQTVLEHLYKQHGATNHCVAIVSHGGFYMEFCRILFQVDNPNCWFSMNNTGVSRFDFRENGEVALVYHNRTSHLPNDLIT